jgi:hypothetical protein
MRTCSRCFRTLTLENFYLRSDRNRKLGSLRRDCKDCVRRGARERRKRITPEEERTRHLRRSYGITPEDYDTLAVAQGHVCAICGKTPKPGKWHVLHIDHDHKTGRVRGLLCFRCNNAIGQLEDDPDLLRSAIAYLEKAELSGGDRLEEPEVVRAAA